MSVDSVTDADTIGDTLWVDGARYGEETLEGEGTGYAGFEFEGGFSGRVDGRWGGRGRGEEFATVVGFADPVGFAVAGGGEAREEEDVEFGWCVGG